MNRREEEREGRTQSGAKDHPHYTLEYLGASTCLLAQFYLMLEGQLILLTESTDLLAPRLPVLGSFTSYRRASLYS